MSRILVTGASGFIGRHLLPTLRATGHEVIPLSRADGDVAEPDTWAALPPTTCVVHLAARSFVPESWSEPDDYLRNNLIGTSRALEYCRMHQARFVFLSSYLYGATEPLPTNEDAPLVARNPYALSKKLAEELCRFYAEGFGVDTTVLRPFNVYGPGQSEPFLIPFVLRQAREADVIRVKTLVPRRDYVYVKDVVDGIVRATDGHHGYRVFNLGSGRSHSVDELIREIQHVAGTKLPIVVDDEHRKDEIMDTIADISAARNALGWEPRFTLRQGLQDFIHSTRDEA